MNSMAPVRLSHLWALTSSRPMWQLSSHTALPHAHHDVPAWPPATFDISAPPGRSPEGFVCSYVVLCYVCCYGCYTSQERIDASAGPRLLAFSSSLLARALLTIGSEDSEIQRDNWCYEQDQQYIRQSFLEQYEIIILYYT